MLILDENLKQHSLIVTIPNVCVKYTSPIPHYKTMKDAYQSQ